MAEIAIIGGTGVYDPSILEDIREEAVDTPYGRVTFQVGRYQGREVAFLNRHGKGHALPPHKVNYRANIWALWKAGVRHVIATAAVGSCNWEMKPGDCVIVSDFIDFTKTRTYTFFEGGSEAPGVVHADFTQAYCPALRELLVQAAKELGLRHHASGIYVATEGPRFETPAEIKMIRQWGGDLVGMTNVPEVVLARELGLCYSVIAMVTNMAAGISATPLTHQEVLDIMAENSETIRRLAIATLGRIPRERTCPCPHEPAAPMHV